MRRFSDAKAALPRKSDGGGAPSLPWRTSALPRGNAEKRLCPFSLIAPCLSFPTAPKRHSESKREAGALAMQCGFDAGLDFRAKCEGLAEEFGDAGECGMRVGD